MLPDVTFADDRVPVFTIPHIVRAESMAELFWFESNELSHAMIGENIAWVRLAHDHRTLGQESEIVHSLYAHPNKPMMLVVRDKWTPGSITTYATIVELTANAMWPRPRATTGQNISDADAGDNAHAPAELQPVDTMILSFVISPGKPNLFGEDARREIKLRTAGAQQ